MRVLSAHEMAAVDRRAIEELGIPGVVLMENAALAAVDALCERLPQASRIALFCGPGNNGGDGLAMARHLDARGYETLIFVAPGSSPMSGDGALQLAIVHASGRRIDEITDEASAEGALRDACRCDAVVDALFGTGLSRPLVGYFATLVEGMENLGLPLIAVDLPSGLDASESEPIGPFLNADLTITFAAPKIAQVLPPACDAMGELLVADLGIPQELVAEAPGTWHLLTGDELAAEIGVAPAGAHKGTFGHAVVVAGGRGGAGAAVLAARAAVCSGAGLVTAAVPERLWQSVDASSIESMTIGLSEIGGGLSECAADEVMALLDGKDSLALGPGLGTDAETIRAVLKILEQAELPMVLDADGLNAVAGDQSVLSARTAPTVLTPHPGEMARLLHCEVREVEADRPHAALSLAAASGCVVVLKGRRSLMASPAGELWINPTGNSGMATGGSGDVLTGMIAALLAQGYEAEAAARLGVFCHGLAGDLALDEIGRAGMAAGDLISFLPRAWKSLEES